MPETTASSADHPAAATLAALLDGNRRFVAGEPRHRRDIAAARKAAPSQQPGAAVFTCIDSRVTAEALFDCDFGEILVVRTAGHVPDRAAVGSLEFAAAAMGVDLVVVLGHERCGAVGAALSAVAADAGEPGGYLVEQLWQPAAQALAEADAEADTASHAMRLHVARTAADLRRRPALADALVVGAVYDLDTGVLTIVDQS